MRPASEFDGDGSSLCGSSGSSPVPSPSRASPSRPLPIGLPARSARSPYVSRHKDEHLREQQSQRKEQNEKHSASAKEEQTAAKVEPSEGASVPQVRPQAWVSDGVRDSLSPSRAAASLPVGLPLTLPVGRSVRGPYVSKRKDEHLRQRRQRKEPSEQQSVNEEPCVNAESSEEGLQTQTRWSLGGIEDIEEELGGGEVEMQEEEEAADVSPLDLTPLDMTSAQPTPAQPEDLRPPLPANEQQQQHEESPMGSSLRPKHSSPRQASSPLTPSRKLQLPGTVPRPTHRPAMKPRQSPQSLERARVAERVKLERAQREHAERTRENVIDSAVGMNGGGATQLPTGLPTSVCASTPAPDFGKPKCTADKPTEESVVPPPDPKLNDVYRHEHEPLPEAKAATVHLSPRSKLAWAPMPKVAKPTPFLPTPQSPPRAQSFAGASAASIAGTLERTLSLTSSLKKSKVEKVDPLDWAASARRERGESGGAGLAARLAAVSASPSLGAAAAATASNGVTKGSRRDGGRRLGAAFSAAATIEAANAAVRAAAEEEAARYRASAKAEEQVKVARAKALERLKLVREKEREAKLVESMQHPTPRRKNQTEFIHEEEYARRAAQAAEERRWEEEERQAAIALERDKEAERQRQRLEEEAKEEAMRQEELRRIIETHWKNNRRRIAASLNHRERIMSGKALEEEQKQGKLESSRRPLS